MNLHAIPHLEQRSAEWFAVRQGRPTASDAKFIITPKKAELSGAMRSPDWQLMKLATMKDWSMGSMFPASF